MRNIDGYGRSAVEFFTDMRREIDRDPIALFVLTSWGEVQFKRTGADLSLFLESGIQFLLRSGVVISYMYFDGRFNRWAPMPKCVGLSVEECVDFVVREWERHGDAISDEIWFVTYS